MNFYQTVFPEKNYLENVHKKRQVRGINPLLFTLSGPNYE